MPTAKKTALVAIRAPNPSSCASGQTNLYVMATAPHTVGRPSINVRRVRLGSSPVGALVLIRIMPTAPYDSALAGRPGDRNDSVDRLPVRDRIIENPHPNE